MIVCISNGGISGPTGHVLASQSTNSNNAQPCWIHLCSIKKVIHTQGNMYSIRVLFGDGNNGQAKQNVFADILFQDGWTGSLDGKPGVSCEFHNISNTNLHNVIIKVPAKDVNNYDLWIYKPVNYSRFSFYAHYNPYFINIEDKTTDYSVDEPADGASGNCDVAMVNAGLAAYPIGAVYWSFVSTSPASLFGGTWTQLEDDRFLMPHNGSPGTNGGSATINISHSHSAGSLKAAIGAINDDQFILGYEATGYIPGVAYRSRYGAAGEVPEYSHANHATSVYGDTANGGSTSISIYPPYTTVYAWRRIG